MTSRSKRGQSRQALTHFDAAGAARMVGVEAKPETAREAVACGVVVMAAKTAREIRRGGIGKGDVLAVARLAGIAAAKRTADLIPLCHPLRLTGVDLSLQVARDRVEIRAIVRAVDRTGVEMEALTAVAVAGLTIYDMCKAIDRAMVVGPLWLEEKRGGASGHWQRAKAKRTSQK